MIGQSKILTVSYGTFSCTLEGFDEPFGTMKAIAEYFRDLAADDRYFGAEPPTPDAAMLHRIAEREIQRRVEAKIEENGVVLRAGETDGRATAPVTERPLLHPATAPASPDAAPAVAPTPGMPLAEVAASEAPAAMPEPLPAAAESRSSIEDSVAAKLARIRAAVDRSRPAPAPVSAPLAATGLVDEAEDYFADVMGPQAADVPQAAEPRPQDTPAPAPQAAPESVAAAGDLPGADTAAEAQHLRVEEAEPEATDAPESALDPEVAAEPEQAEAPAADAAVAAALAVPADSDVNAEAFTADPDTGEAPEATQDDTEIRAAADDVALDADDDTESFLPDDEGEDEVTGFEDNARRAVRPIAPVIESVEDAELVSEIHAVAPNESDDTPAEAQETEAEFDATPPVTETFDDAELLRSIADTLRAAPGAEDTAAALAPAQGESADLADVGSLFEADEDDTLFDDEELPRPAAAAPVDADDHADDDAAPEMAGDASGTGDQEGDTPAAGPIRPVRPRVVKVRRLGTAAQSGAAPSGLSPEAEADLARELAEVEREMAVATGTTDAPETGEDDPAEAADMQTAAAAGTRKPAPSDSSVDRLLAQTNSEMQVPETRRRVATLAHLKAAVAVTVAERLGRKPRDVDAEAEARTDPYREDLAQVVRPRRPEPVPGGNMLRRTSATAERIPPLVLVSEQRIDRPAAAAPEQPAAAAAGGAIRPRRVTTSSLALSEMPEVDEDEESPCVETGRSFEEFARRLHAEELVDLMEASAAYVTLVEGRDSFTRPQLMRHVGASPQGEADFNREDGLRAFGTLLRQGRLQKARRGQFMLAPDSRLLDEARKNGLAGG